VLLVWAALRTEGRGAPDWTLLLEGGQPCWRFTVLLLVDAAVGYALGVLAQLLMVASSLGSGLDLNEEPRPTCRPGAPCR